MITEARSSRCKKCIVRSDKLSVLSFVFAILSDYLKVWRKILHDGSENISIIGLGDNHQGGAPVRF